MSHDRTNEQTNGTHAIREKTIFSLELVPCANATHMPIPPFWSIRFRFGIFVFGFTRPTPARLCSAINGRPQPKRFVHRTALLHTWFFKGLLNYY
jgi:hypothetical protein